MSFSPAVGLGGYSGWMLLKRTQAVQRDTFAKQATVKRDEAYFRENIKKVETAEDLIADRRLLRISLGAFGLQDDINNSFFLGSVAQIP